MNTKNSIGTLREHSLHAALKQWLAQPGDAFEEKVDGYHIDIVRGETLIEIQTANFSMIRRKLTKLLDSHKVLLVHPIPVNKWIVRTTKRNKKTGRRKSPKRGRLEHIFDELLYILEIVNHPNFALQVVLTEQEEIWKNDGRGSWRRKHWSISDKVLLNVLDHAEFHSLDDYLSFIPSTLGDPFTHKQLAKAINAPVWLSTRMSYCLRRMGVLKVTGKDGRALLLSATKSVDTIN